MPKISLENQKIEKRLVTLEVLMKDTRKDLVDVKRQVFNEIPHKIEEIWDKIHQHELSIKAWLVGILVSIIMLLLGTVLVLLRLYAIK